MRTYSLIGILVSFGLFVFVSCQEGLTIMNGLPSTPVTKSGDSEMLTSKPDTNIISKWDALKIVEPITSKYPDRWVDISNDIIPAGSTIAYNMLGHVMEIDDRSYITSPDFDSWLLVVGYDPSFLGKQNLLHLFVNIESGDIIERWIEGRAIVDWDTSRNTYSVDRNLPSMPDRDPNISSIRNTTPNKWAVIISGGSCPDDNYSCFYEDTKRLYNNLIQILGYPNYNIYCLMSDGNDPGDDQRTGPNSYINSCTDFDNDGYSDVFNEAKKTRISNAFNWLGLLTSSGDEVLVVLIGHGMQDEGFCLWDNEVLSPSELNTELDKIDSSVKIDVVLSCCYSGYFVSTLSETNRTISTSSSASETSGAHYYGSNASCIFLRRWINSIPIYDDTNTNDADVAPLELFNSARDSLATVPTRSEHPQYDSTPQDFGSIHTLKGETIPYISGSNYLSTSMNCNYTMINYPSSSTVTWNAGSNTTLVSYTDSTAVMKGKITESSLFCSTTTPFSASVSVDGKMHTITRHIDSVWKPGYYIDGGHIWGSNGTYQVRYMGGEYGYQWFSDNPAWQVTGYIASTATVLEGPTNDPVNLIVSFYGPLGDPIIVQEQVY